MKKPTIIIDFDIFVPHVYALLNYIDIIDQDHNQNIQNCKIEEDIMLNEEEMDSYEKLLKDLETPSKLLYI